MKYTDQIYYHVSLPLRQVFPLLFVKQCMVSIIFNHLNKQAHHSCPPFPFIPHLPPIHPLLVPPRALRNILLHLCDNLRVINQLQKTRKNVFVAQYNLVSMNLENADDGSMLFAGEGLSCLYSFKEDLLDKATNHNISDLKHSHFPHAFENSPQKGSFFFTPNSPKPLRFDLAPDSSHPIHHTISHPSRHAISRKLNLEEEFQEVEEKDSPSAQATLKPFGPNRSSKNSKGLKNLSESVYMIVSQLSITKYKEVADRLVSDIITEEEQDEKGTRRKDEHNVKRRVYDALNVLIAAGLLRKQGKEVLCNDTLGRMDEPSIDPYQLREKQRLEEQLQERITIINQKQQKLQKLQNKRNLIEYIINRNKVEPHGQDQILRFPLIGTLVNNPQACSQRLVGTNTVLVRLGQKVRLYGDVDLLLQINKDKMQMQNLLDNICCSQSRSNECKMEREGGN